MADVAGIIRKAVKLLLAEEKLHREALIECARRKRELHELLDELTPTMPTSASQSFRKAAAELEPKP